MLTLRRPCNPVMQPAIALLLFATVVPACSKTQPTNNKSVRFRVAEEGKQEEIKSGQYRHQAERAALAFINSIRAGTQQGEILADAELSLRDRHRALQSLKQFVNSQEWQRWFTGIEIINGHEDSAECYFRGSSGEILLLLLGYYVDVKEWRVEAYEIPTITFKRPAGESYASYIDGSISKARNGAKSYKEGVSVDGRYYIDYQSIAVPLQR